MAEATRRGRVITTSTNGVTITGAQLIQSIKCLAGGSGLSINIKNGASAIIWEAVLAANTSSIDNYKGGFFIPDDTYTINITAGGGTIYITVL